MKRSEIVKYISEHFAVLDERWRNLSSNEVEKYADACLAKNLTKRSDIKNYLFSSFGLSWR